MSTSAPNPPPLSVGSLSRSWENGDRVDGAQAAAAQWAETFKDFPPVQKANSFTLDDALRMMHDCSRRGRKILGEGSQVMTTNTLGFLSCARN